jgi:hypothetical protein
MVCAPWKTWFVQVGGYVAEKNSIKKSIDKKSIAMDCSGRAN